MQGLRAWTPRGRITVRPARDYEIQTFAWRDRTKHAVTECTTPWAPAHLAAQSLYADDAYSRWSGRDTLLFALVVLTLGILVQIYLVFTEDPEVLRQAFDL